MDRKQAATPAVGARVCPRCGVEYPDAAVAFYRKGPGRYGGACKECCSARNAERYRASPETFHARRAEVLSRAKADGRYAEWCSRAERNRRAKAVDLPLEKRAELRDRQRAWQRASHRRHLAAERARRRAYYERERERLNARRTEWRRDNPEKARAADLRRRAREMAAAGSATAGQIAARVAVWGWRCWMCGGEPSSIDHVIPLARGGTNWPANLRPACQRCNARKGARRVPLGAHRAPFPNRPGVSMDGPALPASRSLLSTE